MSKMTKEESVRRLELWIEVLRDVIAKEKPFSMGSWVGTQASLKGDRPVEHFCGTAACAAGYAALDPRFETMGLVMIDETKSSESTGWPTLSPKEVIEASAESLATMEIFVGYRRPDGSFSYDGGKAFGITEGQFDAITLPSSYCSIALGTIIKPSNVIDVIQRVIKKVRAS